MAHTGNREKLMLAADRFLSRHVGLPIHTMMVNNDHLGGEMALKLNLAYSVIFSSPGMQTFGVRPI